MEPYQELEARFAEFCGNPNTVAVSTGTAALQIGLEALQLPEQSAVIVPEFTQIACARAVSLANLKPRFIDCCYDGHAREWWLTMDHNLLPRYRGKNVRAVMPVHIYGRRCNMDAIVQKVRTYYPNAFIIEDLAEAHGVAPHPETDVACWSFYRNKIICGEEGGMVAFKNPNHASIARSIRNQGFTELHNFYHRPRGVNGRMTNTQAELIIRSLVNYPYNATRRREVEQWYDQLVPDPWKMPPRQSCWVYDLKLPPDVEIDRVVRALTDGGIAARHSFKPMTMQPEYLVEGFHKLNAFKASREVMYLPITPNMTRPQVKLAIDNLFRTLPIRTV